MNSLEPCRHMVFISSSLFCPLQEAAASTPAACSSVQSHQPTPNRHVNGDPDRDDVSGTNPGRWPVSVKLPPRSTVVSPPEV
eukprot:SAG31_NODE_9720_length_1237_cov_1.273286_1_plen_81_part_10